MISPPVRALLDTIGKIEAGKRGYNALYLPAERKLGRQNITAMTIREVQALQQRMVKVSASSAVGRYQFIRKTLRGLVRQFGLSGGEKFGPALQDRFAVRLMEGRGLTRFLAGKISAEAFANGLAHEWASLPCIGGPHHGKPSPEAMRKSCYAGDGLNHALMTPEAFLDLVNALTASQEPVQPPEPVLAGMVPMSAKPAPEPSVKPEKPKSRWQKITGAIGVAVGTGVAWFHENVELLIGLGVVAAIVVGVIIWRRRG